MSSSSLKYFLEDLRIMAINSVISFFWVCMAFLVMRFSFLEFLSAWVRILISFLITEYSLWIYLMWWFLVSTILLKFIASSLNHLRDFWSVLMRLSSFILNCYSVICFLIKRSSCCTLNMWPFYKYNWDEEITYTIGRYKISFMPLHHSIDQGVHSVYWLV